VDCGACPDITAPVISNVQNSSITNSSTIISWNTNENANASVLYGLTIGLGSSAGRASYLTLHSLMLNSLANDTLYYYKTESCDAVGNCANSTIYDFRTLATGFVCGNEMREGSEICDGTDLAGQTCQSLGYGSGTLGCYVDCSGFNASLCVSGGYNFYFSDNFNDGAADGWFERDYTPTPEGNGIWNVAVDSVSGSSAYQISGAFSNADVPWRLGEYSLLDGYIFSDFQITGRMRTTNTDRIDRDLSIVFGYQNDLNYYAALFANSNPGYTNGLFIVEGGNDIARIGSIPVQASLNNNQYAAFRIVKIGNTIEMYVNNSGAEVLIASATDPQFATGMIGLGTTADTGFFDDIALDAVLAESKPRVGAFYQFPLNLSTGEIVYSFCNVSDSETSASGLNVSQRYKLSSSGTWNSLSSVFWNRQVIQTIGDSITAGWDTHDPDPARFPGADPIDHQYQYWFDGYLNSNVSAVNSLGYEIYNHGYGGQTCNGLIQSNFISDTNGANYAIILCGTNGVDQWQSVSQPAIQNMVNSARSRGITPILMTIPPMDYTAYSGRYCSYVDAYNNWLRTYAQSNNLILVDLHPLFNNGENCVEGTHTGLNESLFDYDSAGWVHPNVEGHKVIARAIFEQAFHRGVFGGYMANASLNNAGSYDFSCDVSDGIFTDSKTNFGSVIAAANPSCGDLSCNGLENCSSCAVDCGACSDITAPARNNGNPSGILPIGTTSVNINLTTDETAMCRYSNTAGQSYSSMTDTLLRNANLHYSALNGLSAGAYNYYARCNDTAGNFNTNDYLISFSIAADTTAPVISNLQNSSITNASAVITWQTNENANSIVYYGLSAVNLNLNAVDAGYLLSHIINLNNLGGNSTYYYKAGSCDASGNCVNSSIYNFKTLANSVPYVDNEAPIVMLNSPANDFASSAKEVEFNYSVTDYSLIPNCSVLIGVEKRIDFNIINGRENVFVLSLGNGEHYWNISCADSLGNIGESETRKFSVNYIAPVDETGDTGTGSGGGGGGGFPVIKPKPTAGNITNVSITDEREKIILGDELIYVDATGEEKIIVDLYGNSYLVSFILTEDGKIVAKLFNGDYIIPRKDVLPISLGGRKMYVGIVEGEEQVVLGLDANAVSEKTGKVESRGSELEGGLKIAYYILIWVVGILVATIIALAVWYFVGARKKEKGIGEIRMGLK